MALRPVFNRSCCSSLNGAALRTRPDIRLQIATAAAAQDAGLTEQAADRYEAIADQTGRDVADLVGKTNYIDYKALGYKGDPIIYGGRFKKLPMGYKAEK